MTPKERVLALLRGVIPDRLPFVHCDRHFPRGEKEREARNKGMGLLCYRPCYIERISNVKLVKESEPNTLVQTYQTPVGSLTEVLRHGAGYGIARYGRDWKGVTARRREFLVKSSKDYKVLKFIAENIHYEPYYYPVEDQVSRLGEDGIVVATIPYDPFQRLLLEWVGSRLYIDLAKDREIIEEIYEIVEEKYEEQLFPIAADSPCEVIMYGGNIDSILVSPSLFGKYHLPSYTKCAETLHAKDKILNVHMDGRLRALAELIAKSKVDIVEAFTPPPTGDLPINEALSLWKNKIIWVNFPSTISTLMGPCPRTVKEYLIQQLGLMIPGEKALLIASTENYVPEENIMAMIEVMEKAALPLSREVITKIRNSSLGF